MKVRVNTLRSNRGIAFRISFFCKYTSKGELDGIFELFFIRWGFNFRFGPEYLVG